MSGSSLGNDADAFELVRALSDASSRVGLADFPRPNDGVEHPGVYAWFVDPDGAAAVSSGLGLTVQPGLIYGGQAGSGLSSATIRSRVLNNHIRGNVTASTFRLTLAAVLDRELGLERGGGRRLAGDGEARLSRWMADHLQAAVAPVTDRARLAILEAILLAELDPPLNLQGMAPTPLRAALTRLRRQLSAKARHARRSEAPAATGIPHAAGQGPDMGAFLRGLVGRTIPTLSGRLNRVLGVTEDTVLVGSSRAPTGQPVPLVWIQDAADRLFAEGQVIINVATVGYRSAFVGAALAALPGSHIDKSPPRVVLASQAWPPHTS